MLVVGVLVVAQDIVPLLHDGHEEEVFGEVEGEEGLYQRLGQGKVASALPVWDWGFEEVEFAQAHGLHLVDRMGLLDAAEG